MPIIRPRGALKVRPERKIYAVMATKTMPVMARAAVIMAGATREAK